MKDNKRLHSTRWKKSEWDYIKEVSKRTKEDVSTIIRDGAIAHAKAIDDISNTCMELPMHINSFV